QAVIQKRRLIESVKRDGGIAVKLYDPICRESEPHVWDKSQGQASRQGRRQQARG
ncbi:hypothetical protein CCMA1212_000207, partial [Trichoderma ghanense]